MTWGVMFTWFQGHVSTGRHGEAGSKVIGCVISRLFE